MCLGSSGHCIWPNPSLPCHRANQAATTREAGATDGTLLNREGLGFTRQRSHCAGAGEGRGGPGASSPLEPQQQAWGEQWSIRQQSTSLAGKTTLATWTTVPSRLGTSDWSASRACCPVCHTGIPTEAPGSVTYGSCRTQSRPRLPLGTHVPRC